MAYAIDFASGSFSSTYPKLFALTSFFFMEISINNFLIPEMTTVLFAETLYATTV